MEFQVSSIIITDLECKKASLLSREHCYNSLGYQVFFLIEESLIKKSSEI